MWPGLLPGPGVKNYVGRTLLLVLVLAPRGFFRGSSGIFLPSQKKKNFQFRSGIQESQVYQLKDCLVSPSLNKVDLFYFYLDA